MYLILIFSLNILLAAVNADIFDNSFSKSEISSLQLKHLSVPILKERINDLLDKISSVSDVESYNITSKINYLENEIQHLIPFTNLVKELHRDLNIYVNYINGVFHGKKVQDYTDNINKFLIDNNPIVNCNKFLLGFNNRVIWTTIKFNSCIGLVNNSSRMPRIPYTANELVTHLQPIKASFDCPNNGTDFYSCMKEVRLNLNREIDLLRVILMNRVNDLESMRTDCYTLLACFYSYASTYIEDFEAVKKDFAEFCNN